MSVPAFGFEAGAVQLELYGHRFSIKIGDPATVDRIDSAVARLSGADAGEGFEAMSGMLRETLRAAMGDDDFEAVYSARRPNVIEEMRALAYIKRRIADATEGGSAFEDAVRELVGEGAAEK